MKSKEATLAEAEGEVHKLKAQQASYQKELEHLKALEERYRQENSDLQRRIDGESSKNLDLGAAIKDLEQKIRTREDQIIQMRKELDGARYSNSALLDNNSGL